MPRYEAWPARALEQRSSCRGLFSLVVIPATESAVAFDVVCFLQHLRIRFTQTEDVPPPHLKTSHAQSRSHPRRSRPSSFLSSTHCAAFSPPVLAAPSFASHGSRRSRLPAALDPVRSTRTAPSTAIITSSLVKSISFQFAAAGPYTNPPVHLQIGDHRQPPPPAAGHAVRSPAPLLRDDSSQSRLRPRPSSTAPLAAADRSLSKKRSPPPIRETGAALPSPRHPPQSKPSASVRREASHPARSPRSSILRSPHTPAPACPARSTPLREMPAASP